MSLATLSSAGLRDKALESIPKLPPFSPVLNKLMASLTDEDISFAELAAVIEKDTVLAGSVLRAVNSAFYARRGTVNSVKHAVAVLGIGKLRNLSMSMSLARMWNATGLPSGWSSRSFNQHAVASAILADLLAVELDTEYAEGAFTAGLLQNVGLVLIALGLPTQYDSVLKAYQTGTGCLSDYEEGYIGVTHAELSGEILSRWHLPEPIAEAVARHHGPHASDKPRPLSRVLELAGTMTEQQGILPQPWMRKPDGAPAHVLASLGLEGRAEAVLENFKGEYDTIKPFFG